MSNITAPQSVAHSRPAARARWLAAGLAIWASLLLCRAGAAQTNVPVVTRSETETNLASALQLRSGFRAQVVAAEPMVQTPVAMAFDERGRLYVGEWQGTGNQGRIRLLSSPDDDGSFRESTLFADALPAVGGLACYDGGVYVAAGREIMYLKDTEGRGKANVRRSVFTGFTNLPAYATQGAMLHTIAWGPDNRLHVGSAGLGIQLPGNTPGAAPQMFGGVDFSFDPRAPVLVPESGRSVSGLAFDRRGWKFASDPDRPLRLSMYREASMNRNPFAPLPPAFVEVVRGDAQVYKTFSTLNPAAPSRTTNAIAPVFMLNARSPMIYRSPFTGTNAIMYALIPDPTLGIVHRVELRESDFVVSAFRAREDAGAEFISSADADFRPMALANGPDGAIWLCDRRVNPEQGRIYRIIPTGASPLPPQDLSSSNTYHLVSLLSHSGAWHRETASRLLYERRDASAASLLTNVVVNSRVPAARVAALWAMAGLGAAPESLVFRAARDTDATVREHALILLEQAGGKGVSEDFLRYLGSLARDGSPRVRYQLALTLGVLPKPGRAQALAEVFLRDPGNPWISAAVLSSVDRDTVELLSLILLNVQARSNPAVFEFQTRLAEMVGVSGREELAQQLTQLVTRSGLEPVRVYAILAALGDGLDRARKSLSEAVAPEVLEVSYLQALEVALTASADPNLRAQAVRFLGSAASSYSEFGDWLLNVLNPNEPLPVLLAGISTLGRYTNPQVASELMRRLPGMPLAARREAAAALLYRSDRASAVLDALQARALQPTDLQSSHLDYLRVHQDSSVSARATALLGPIVVERPAVVQRFTNAVALSGSSANGRSIFLQRCASCHRLGNDGTAGSMDLVTSKGRSRAQLLSDIVEPNRAIRPEATTWVVDTKHGRTYIGTLRNENPSSLILAQSNGQQTVIPKENVLYHKAQNWSLMPSNLADDLSPQALADLLAYLTATPASGTTRTTPSGSQRNTVPR